MNRSKQTSVEGTVVNDWLSSILRRLNNNLPYKSSSFGPSQEKAVLESATGLLELSSFHFVPVVEGIMKLIDTIQQIAPPSSADDHALQSYCVLLKCLTDILNNKSSSASEDVHVLERLSHKIWQLCMLEGEKVSSLVEMASEVLDPLSRLHFATLYTTKIVLKLTSPVGSATTTVEEGMWQLIPCLNLNTTRLVNILSAVNTCLRNQKKQRLLPVIVGPVKKAVLKFVQDYTVEFNLLASEQNSKLSQQAETLFEVADSYSDNVKKKSSLWPLQNILLMLCPNILKKMAAGSTSENLKTKLAFIKSIQKSMTNKQFSDIAALCCVETAKVCSLVDPKETTVYRYYVTAIQAQLQDVLFSPREPFIHNSASTAAGVPLFNDLQLMVDCFVSHYRINHRNNHLTYVCLDPASPTVFKLVLARSVHDLIAVQTPLSWWPHIDTLNHLGSNLRSLFHEQLNSLRKSDPSFLSPNDIRTFSQSIASGTTLLNSKPKSDRKLVVEALLDYELIRVLIDVFIIAPELAFAGDNNSQGHDSLRLMTTLAGLVQHPNMPDLALRASETLLALHKPEHIDLWSKHTTLKSFFDISCQVTFTLAMKLISRKTTDSSQLLHWFKQILHYRSIFLYQHKDEATFDREDNRFFTKTQNMVEVVMLTYLHIPDVSQIQLAMSCFGYLVKEAEILMSGEEGQSLVPYSANVDAYRDLARMSKEKQIGRASQQKKIYSILKKIVCTDGSAMAWDDSYNTWRSLTTVLTSYQKEEAPPPSQDLLRVPIEHFTRTVKRYSAVSSNAGELSDEALQSTLMEWSNITGFLCAAGGVAIRQTEGTRLHQRITFSPVPVQSPPPTSTSQDIFSPRSGPRRSNSYAGERRYRTHRRQASNTSTNSDKDRTVERDRCDSDTPPTTNPDAFVSELLGLLRCDNEAIGGQVWLSGCGYQH
jgi:neurofibromin 1